MPTREGVWRLEIGFQTIPIRFMVSSSSRWSSASILAPREGSLPCSRAGAKGSDLADARCSSSRSSFSVAASLFERLRLSLDKGQIEC